MRPGRLSAHFIFRACDSLDFVISTTLVRKTSDLQSLQPPYPHLTASYNALGLVFFTPNQATNSSQSNPTTTKTRQKQDSNFAINVLFFASIHTKSLALLLLYYCSSLKLIFIYGH